MRILLLEDNLELSDYIAKFLEKEGFIVDKVQTLAHARDMLSYQSYDIAVIDRLLPDGQGEELLPDLNKASIPALALTALNQEKQVVAGIKQGFDNYLTKPINLKILSAHLNVLGRSKPKKITQFQYHSLMLMPQKHLATINNHPVVLTAKEFSLLSLLIQSGQSGAHLTLILKTIWDRNDNMDKNKLNTAISRLRKKLSPDPKLHITHLKGSYKLTYDQ